LVIQKALSRGVPVVLANDEDVDASSAADALAQASSSQ
jgi:hypothetical protein